MSDSGLSTRQSKHDFATTLQRLTQVLETKGVTNFARIDHAAGAAGVGLALAPTTLVIINNPNVGTASMQAEQRTGIGMPLRNRQSAA